MFRSVTAAESRRSRSALAVPVGLALLSLAATGCLSGPSSPATTPPPSVTVAPTASPSESPGRDEPRFLVTCFYPDGREVATFTRLEEAWASTNYVRIDRCEAAVAASDGFELTDSETAVAQVAAAGLPDEDLTELFLRTLAACVRTPPDGDYGVGTYPDPILEAALVLCPEAPHAVIMREELAAGSGG